jgi:hypothetical protein
VRKPGPRTLLAISAGLAAVLLAQGAADLLIARTIFPTVTMPGFDIAPRRDGTATLTELSTYLPTADGERTEVKPEDLMSPMMYSAVRATLQRFVRKEEGGPLTAETRDWLFARADGIAKSPVEEIEFVWQTDDFNIVTLESTPVAEPETVRITR